MMPELSQRVARAVNTLSMSELSRHARVQLARDAAPVAIYDELPQWIKNVIEKAETK